MKQETERRRRQRGGRQESEGNSEWGSGREEKTAVQRGRKGEGVNRTWTRGISKTRRRQSCLPLRALALSHRKVNIPVPPSNGLRPPNSGLS